MSLNLIVNVLMFLFGPFMFTYVNIKEKNSNKI